MYNHLSTSRASLSFSVNDCPQNCSSSSDGGYPSSCCCCCCCSCSCCCSIPTNTVAVNSFRLVVPMNPSPPFYGFRQSTLIQLPLPRRRMMFGPPVGDLGPTWSRTYGRLDCVRDDRIRDEGVKCKGNGMGLWGGYYSGMSSDACDDADELISLLSEGLGGEDFGVSERRKKVGLSRKGKVRAGGRFVVMEERVYGRGMEGCLWDELESVWARGCRMERLGKEFVKGDGLRLRKGGSFGSLYYSKMKWKEECVEDGLVGSEKESRKRVGVLVVDKRAEDELERRRIEKYQSVRRDDIEVRTCAGLDLRRKSKKKTGKGLIEETASGKKSVLKQSRLSEAHVSGSEMGSSMRNRYSYRVGESVSDMNSSFGHSRIDNRVSGTSNSRYKHEAVTGNSGFVDKKSMSHSSKFTGREEHVVSASEVCGTCGRVTSGSQAGSSNEQQSKFTQIQCDSAGFISSNEKQSKQEMSSSLIQKSAEEVNQRHKQEHLLASNRINLRKYENYTERADTAERYEENTGISRRHAKLSEIENMGMRLASTVRKQSDTRIKKQEGTSTLIQASLKEEDERSHQECLVATSQTELMRKNQKRIEIVDTGNIYLQHTSRTQQQQDAQVKRSKENTVLISSQFAEGETYHADIQVTSQNQSTKESEVLSGSSQVHFDETIVNSSSASEERLHSDSQLAQVKGSEETTVLISSQLAKGEKYQTDIQFTSQKQSRKESEVLSGSSHVHFDETIVNSSSASEQRLHSEKTYLSEKVKEIHEHVKETIKHTELRYEVQTPLREPSIVKKETSGYPYVTSTSQAELRHEVQTPLREPSIVKKDSSRYPYVTSTSQVRIEEIDEEEDQINFPSDPPPRLAKPHAKETIKQTEHRYEVHTPVKEPSIVKETSRYPYVTSTSQVRIEEIGEEEDERNLPSRPSPRLAQPPQSIEVHPVSIESASRFSSQDSRRNSEGESSICIEPLATDASPQVDVLGSAERMESSYHQVIGDFVANIRHQESTSVIEMENNLPKRQLLNEEVVFTCEHSAQSDSESGKLMKECSRCSSGSGTGKDPLATDASPHVDLLGSAERMDNLYHQVIGNFVENIRHEQSTSVIEIEKKLPKWQSQSEGVGCTHEESVHSDSESGKLMKEPAGEILTLQQPPEREASDTDAAPQNGTPRRSGRTLWNVVANIARLRWGVLGESRKSTVKSGGQSSLSDSTGSESLFSGYYPNDAQGGNMDLGTLRTQIEPSSTYQPLLVLNTGDDTGLAVDSGLSPSFGGISGDTNIDLNVEMGSQDTASMDWTQSPASQLRRSHRRSDAIYELQEGGIEATGSGTVGQIKGDLDLTVVSSSEENVSELNVDEMSSQATASMDWTQSPASQLRRSHRRSDAIYELQEGGIEAAGSGTVGQIKGDLDPSLTVVSSSEENVLELKGKNLLRSNQVMKERFDEWGEAYRLESEQRKIDQTFMREALEEAKKAAGMWEFPVGAVLVKDGEIIARGHNCVEDLRDSTAHAEILCIREASSIVKTWRLSETALYVTLEPCAMCAGAILQARVGTLVYGAPNKLLGADGSWVRLFPGSSSADAEGGPESTTKPEGPVHPFHPKMIIRRGILETECSDLMQQSFKLRRKTDKKNEQPDEKRSNRKVLHPSKLLHKMHHMFFFC